MSVYITLWQMKNKMCLVMTNLICFMLKIKKKIGLTVILLAMKKHLLSQDVTASFVSFFFFLRLFTSCLRSPLCPRKSSPLNSLEVRFRKS